MNDYLQDLKTGGRPMTKNELKIKELQQRIDKAIEYIKNNWYSKNTRNIDELHSLGDWRLDLLEILGDKEMEEIPLFEGTLEQLNNLSILGDKE